jgi:hypothetical protein
VTEQQQKRARSAWQKAKAKVKAVEQLGNIGLSPQPEGQPVRPPRAPPRPSQLAAPANERPRGCAAEAPPVPAGRDRARARGAEPTQARSSPRAGARKLMPAPPPFARHAIAIFARVSRLRKAPGAHAAGCSARSRRARRSTRRTHLGARGWCSRRGRKPGAGSSLPRSRARRRRPAPHEARTSAQRARRGARRAARRAARSCRRGSGAGGDSCRRRRRRRRRRRGTRRAALGCGARRCC